MAFRQGSCFTKVGAKKKKASPQIRRNVEPDPKFPECGGPVFCYTTFPTDFCIVIGHNDETRSKRSDENPSMAQLQSLHQSLDTHATEGMDGEETWKCIAYPGFRPSKCVKAWKDVSDHGKLRTGDFRVMTATPGKGYCQTSLPVCVEGAYAGTARVPLHRIVAYTFLGPPPSPEYTVDHINRVRHDNRVANLRWASPREQMENRDFPRYTLLQTSTGQVHDSMASVSREVGVGVGTLSSRLRHAERGDSVEVKGCTLTLTDVSRKRMATPQGVVNPPKRKPTSPKRREEALALFVHKKLSVADVGEAMNISRSTALHYIGHAARESQRPFLERLATRIGLACPEARRKLRQGIVDFHAQKPTEKEMYDPAYQKLVLCHAPTLGEDWEIVRATFQSLVHGLDGP